VIIRIDDTKIGDPEELTKTVRMHKPEEKITLTYKRDGKEAKTTATLGKTTTSSYNYNYKYPMPRIEPIPPITLEGFGRENRPRLGIKAQDTEDGKGVKVLDVDDESAAAKAGIKEGDIITRFDGKEVNSAVTLAEAARESRTKTAVKIDLTRDGKPQEVEVRTPRKLRTADL
jgi:serine protease Do